jgi:GNAT superfamily N-acetyltransferase
VNTNVPMIREMSRADAAAVVAGCAWLFEPPASTPPLWDPAAAEVRLSELCESSTGTGFVAVREATIVGFCTVYLDLMSIRMGQRAWLNELAVHPAHRSHGIGKQLFDRARTWARTMGATHLALDSNVVRVDAHRFYEREEPDSQAMCYLWLL